MKLRHLGWAGVEIEHEGHTLLIDVVKDSFYLLPGEKLVSPLGPGKAVAALVTHLHADHADPHAIAYALADGAPVFRPEPNPGTGDDLVLTEKAEAEFRETGLRTEVVPVWEERRAGPFRILAAPSVDGLGDPQHCWVVECDGVRVLHAGDTLFHGYWLSIARRGAIDVAFLPINGAIMDFPPLSPPSPLNAVMMPEEAAVAAALLQAKIAVPIHYELVNNPPEYTETPHPAERFVQKAKEMGVVPKIAVRGEWFSPV